MKSISKPLILALTGLLLSSNGNANPEIHDFDWRDSRYHNKQANQIEVLSLELFGSRLHQDKSDLTILQRLIHKGVIAKNDTERLQALGVVLGNVMAKDFGLEWKIYEDSKGRSRALCTVNTEKTECLFPITMLSRRISVGILPDVTSIYNNAYELIEEHLKKLPYEVD